MLFILPTTFIPFPELSFSPLIHLSFLFSIPLGDIVLFSYSSILPIYIPSWRYRSFLWRIHHSYFLPTFIHSRRYRSLLLFIHLSCSYSILEISFSPLIHLSLILLFHPRDIILVSYFDLFNLLTLTPSPSYSLFSFWSNLPTLIPPRSYLSLLIHLSFLLLFNLEAFSHSWLSFSPLIHLSVLLSLRLKVLEIYFTSIIYQSVKLFPTPEPSFSPLTHLFFLLLFNLETFSLLLINPTYIPFLELAFSPLIHPSILLLFHS